MFENVRLFVGKQIFTHARGKMTIGFANVASIPVSTQKFATMG